MSTIKAHNLAVTSLAVFPFEDSKNILVSCSQDTFIKVYDIRSKYAVAILKGHSSSVNCLAASPDSRLVTSGSSDGIVKVWDLF